MQADALVGRQLAGFRIEELIGRGGMSRVYRAEQVALGRQVALKILSPDLAGDPQFRGRFMTESRLAAGLEHPNVLPIFDAGEYDGQLYLAMRLVRGTDLAKTLARDGALPIRTTLSIARQAGAALDAAHALGLIHRDVKPANLLLVGDHLYLTDFGVARIESAPRDLTRTGSFVGTLDYAAPEQITNSQIDGRTDIYALGCVVYQCLTGRVPFDRPTEHAVMEAHLRDAPPSVTDTGRDTSTGVDNVIHTAMAKRKEDRYRTGKHFADALAAAVEPKRDGIGDPPPRPTIVDRTAPFASTRLSAADGASEPPPHGTESRPAEVIGSESAVIRARPEFLAEGIVRLQPGTRLRAYESVRGYVRVRCPDGRYGWIAETFVRTGSRRPVPLWALVLVAGVAVLAVGGAYALQAPRDIPVVVQSTPTPQIATSTARPTATPAPTISRTPTPTARQVSHRPEQLIMPASELPQVVHAISRDSAVGILGWQRQFETAEFFYLQFYVTVWPPGTRAADRIARETCDFEFDKPPFPVASEVRADVIGDGAKACVYHFESNITDWYQYVTGTRNVTITVAGEPRTIGGQAGAMNRMIQFARQQLTIIDRVSPP